MKTFSKHLAVPFLVVATAAAPSIAQSSSDAVRAQFLPVLDRPRVPLSPATPRVVTEGAYTEELLTFFAERDAVAVAVEAIVTSIPSVELDLH